MVQTHNFRCTVAARARRDLTFCGAFFSEAMNAFLILWLAGRDYYDERKCPVIPVLLSAG